LPQWDECFPVRLDYAGNRFSALKKLFLRYFRAFSREHLTFGGDEGIVLRDADICNAVPFKFKIGKNRKTEPIQLLTFF
jgi:hypothetical protein